MTRPARGPAKDPPPPRTGPRCPTCECAIHAAPRTWEVVCSVCGEKRWPYRATEPEAPYVCPRCQITSPEKREAARAAGKRSAESRRKAFVR
jgi:hypothetical protein